MSRLKKSLGNTVPPQFTAFWWPGQDPTNYSLKRQLQSLTAMPSSRQPETSHPCFTPERVVEGLGLKKDWVQEIAKAMAAPNELLMRQQIYSRMFEERMPADLRRVLFARSLSLWREKGRVLKSYRVFKPSDLKKGGPYIGPRGGKWADPQHKIPWDEKTGSKKNSVSSDSDLPTGELQAKAFKMLGEVIGPLVEKIAPGAKLTEESIRQAQKNTEDGTARRSLSHVGAMIRTTKALKKKSDVVIEGGHTIKTWNASLKRLRRELAAHGGEADATARRQLLEVARKTGWEPKNKDGTLFASIATRFEARGGDITIVQNSRNEWVAIQGPPKNRQKGTSFVVRQATPISDLSGQKKWTSYAGAAAAVGKHMEANKQATDSSKFPKKVELTDGTIAKLEGGASAARFGDYRIYRNGRFVGNAGWSAIQGKVKQTELFKAEARGGTYVKRVPKPGGGYRYFYDEAKYNAHDGAHISGQDAATQVITRQVGQHVQEAGSKGCDLKTLHPLVKRYGAEMVGGYLNEACKSGELVYRGGRLFGRGQSVPSQGANAKSWPSNGSRDRNTAMTKPTPKQKSTPKRDKGGRNTPQKTPLENTPRKPKKPESARKSFLVNMVLRKGGPYIGPKGGKWADPQHTKPWKGEQLKLFVRPGKVDLSAKGLAKIPSVSKAEMDKKFPLKTVPVDWGQRSRGQGKRAGGMVMGAMSDAPTGVKHYASWSKTFNVSGDDAEEIGMLTNTGELHPYRQARTYGLDHEQAMTWLATNRDPKETAKLLSKSLRKAGPHKYIRRVPKPGGGYRYFYRESAIAREATAGEEVRLGKRMAKVLDVADDGTVTIELDGKRQKIPPNKWADLLTRHYGRTYIESARKRAQQTINAVMRHVPRKLLEDLKGATDEERLAELQKRVPEVYGKLQAAFSRAGMSPLAAQRSLSMVLERRGWKPEARALVIGTVIRHRQIGTKELIDASENLAGGRGVHEGHVQAVVELRAPKGKPENFPAEIKNTAQSAESELANLAKALSGEKTDEKAAAVMAEVMQSEAMQKLMLVAQAFPGVVDKAVEPIRKAILAANSLVPNREPTSEGGETIVYVAGEGGTPKALQARYRLVEAEDLIASHSPEGFARRKDYPEGVQERAYHRDKAEQAKVIRNAQNMDPRFVVNTNPDAVNGPPMVTEEGIVLGGNSRAMSMQRIYQMHPDKAEQMRKYLREHAHEVGFQAQDIEAMKNPVLIREVAVEDKSKAGLQLLVRQMNESFTQGMDPRTMQVAMGRKLTNKTLGALADSMQEDETLAAFLSSRRSERFVSALFQAGVIDNRNVNQYMVKGTRTLNNDGKMLVSRILVGRTVDDADILSSTGVQMMDSIAGSVPAMVQATAHGEGYDLGPDLAVAIDAFNELQHKVDTGVLRNLDPKMKPHEVKQLYNQFDMLPGIGEPHPVLQNERAQVLLETLIRKRGPVQLAKVFREYAKIAAANPEGQATMFGAKTSPLDALKQAAGVGNNEPQMRLVASMTG